MHPVLFKIPGINLTIHSYGVMVALGLLVGMWWITREARRKGLNARRVSDLVFYTIVGGVVFSRIFYVLVSQRSEFLHNPLIIFRIWEGGLIFYGGVIGALCVIFWFVRRYRLPLFKLMDCFAPGLALGHALGRIGCLMAGCCYGRVATVGSWYAITFPPDPATFAPAGIPLFPTQLMEAVGEIAIFGILMLVRRFQKFDGQIIATYFIAYSILRSFTEIFRGDIIRGFLIEPWLSTSQFISILIFLAGVAMYIYGLKIKKRS